MNSFISKGVVMLQGIRLKANPTDQQRLILSQWMGCARFIWNAKCDEYRYHNTYARKYCSIRTYAPIDTKTAHFKSKELSPWLYHCPSQIIRNSATNWYQTYQKFMKGICGRPKRKSKTDKGSVYLTRELFQFQVCEDGVTRLFIGTKTNNIGYLSFKSHSSFSEPKSIYIRKDAGHYFISFCYDDGSEEPATDKDHFEYLKGTSKEWLEENVIGIDRGVAIPVHTGSNQYDFTDNQKANKEKRGCYIKRLQRRLAKQKKGSNRRQKTKNRISRQYNQVANIRKDFCHKASRSLVDSDAKVIVFENLKTSNMTCKPKAKQNANGKFLPNQARAKAGLNKSILNVGWHYLETYTRYKATKAGKAVFKVSAAYTSQECANCSHTHPDNRKTQALFSCDNCGHVDNADRNASIVIKKRAINLFLDSGTELVGKGIPLLTKGRGAIRKSRKAKASPAIRSETSKKKRTVTTVVAA
jgi:putative transposase